MLRIPSWKVLAILVTCFLGILFAIPNAFHKDIVKNWPSFLPHHQVNLGLDLKGGSHLLLEVDVDSVIHDRIATSTESFRSLLKSKKIGFTELKSVKADDYADIHITLREVDDRHEVRNLLAQADEDFHIETIDAHQYILHLTPEAIVRRKKAAIDQSIEIVRRRIDESGTLEPNIMRQGDERIVLQLPGVSNPAHVKELLGRTAKLAFRWIENDDTHSIGTEKLPLIDKTIHDDSYHDKDHRHRIHYAVSRSVVLTGDMLVDAQPSFDQNNQPQVTFQLDNKGARRFGEATRHNIGRQLALVLDNEIISAPSIREAIPGGRGVISGHFTIKEANDLALLLRAGALPAPLEVIEERVVGPDLGSDSIKAGGIATILSVLSVCLLMFAVYSIFGLIANVAVIVNIIFLIAGMSILQATLTLPGIAGIALTIGMAVDANVLIYERIKEEFRKGVSVPAAIDAGYQRAMATIIDSNITTLFGTILLYAFGSGPIRGFAVTLTLGILISMFTAISLTRVMIVGWLRIKRHTTIPIGKI